MKKENTIPSSVKEARELNSNSYFTGRECINGHIAMRATVNGTCRECMSERSKVRYIKNRDSYIKKARERYLEKSESIKEYARIYRANNKEKINKRTLKRLREDVDFKATYILRRYIRKLMAVSTGERSKSIRVSDLYYTPKEFVEHIEKQFQSGMSWGNHGEWHIDHIIPISEYIRQNVRDPNIVNCLSNLRPVWASENLTKGDRVSFLL